MSKMNAVDGRERGSPKSGEMLSLSKTVRILSGQMQAESDRIAELTDDIVVFRAGGNDSMADLYDEIRVGSLENLQKIILHLTKLVESDYPAFENTGTVVPDTEVEHAAEIN